MRLNDYTLCMAFGERPVYYLPRRFREMQMVGNGIIYRIFQ